MDSEPQETLSQRICLWIKIFLMLLCCATCWMDDDIDEVSDSHHDNENNV
jgi:hypothetical protein